MRIRRGGAGAHATGHGHTPSVGSAGSSSGTNKNSAAGSVGAGARSKNSFRQVMRVNVEPAPNLDDGTGKACRAPEGEEVTPKSTTISIAYRAPGSAEQDPLASTPTSRRGSNNKTNEALHIDSADAAHEVRLAAPSSSVHGQTDVAPNTCNSDSSNSDERCTHLAFEDVYPNSSEFVGTKEEDFVPS